MRRSGVTVAALLLEGQDFESTENKIPESFLWYFPARSSQIYGAAFFSSAVIRKYRTSR